jgi:multidrug efflux pump subunit AcrA (membrane-fusion protein)
MIRTPCTRAFALLVTSTFLASCGGEDERPQPTETAGKAPSNRVDVPPMVRRNLGIEFATVARRRVAQTLRLPAQVELLPAATQHYTAPFAGRVQVLVAPLQQVEAGDVLYTLDSHEWRATQRELEAEVAAHHRGHVDAVVRCLAGGLGRQWPFVHAAAAGQERRRD